MGAAIRGAEPGRRDVGVDLGRRKALVAEQLLDDAEVRAALEEVRRERVAEGVRRDADRQAGPPPEQVEPVAQAADAERLAAVVQEDLASGSSSWPAAPDAPRRRGRGRPSAR